MDYRLLRADGVYRWVIGQGRPRFDSSGAFLGLIGSVTDITERKLAEQALINANDTFRHLVERSPFGVYAVDADFRLVQVSDGAQKVFENVRPLLGRDFEQVLRIIWPEPFADEAIGRFRHTLTTGQPYHAPPTVEQRADIAVTRVTTGRSSASSCLTAGQALCVTSTIFPSVRRMRKKSRILELGYVSQRHLAGILR